MEFDNGDEVIGDDWILINVSSSVRPDLKPLNTPATI
jgi:hypothetical protein